MPGLNTLRHAVRTLAHSPLFAVTSIASLALGIAASSTIFSIADALFLRPRAGLVEESRLVDVGRATDGQGFDNFGYQVLLALREARLLDGIAGYRFDPSAVSLDNGRGGSERAYAAVVTANYFDVLGTRPAAGRFFRADEDQVPDAVPVVVLEHAFWTRRFGQSPDVVGSTIRVNGRPYGVVGVAEPGFHGSTVTGTDMWMPFAMAPHITGRAGHELLTGHGQVWHLAVARLGTGVSMTQARDELNALLAPLKSAHPDPYGRWSMALLPSARIPGEFRTPVSTFVGILFVLTGMVLAIACTNVAGMLLARAMGRRREMATRLAVGASRTQLVVQLLSETLVLFVAAAAASLLLTWWMVRLLLSFMPSLPLPVHVDLEVNGRMFAFAAGTALLTALVFGLAPALRATRVDLAQSLHGQHSTSDRRRFQLRHLLVGAQVALSLVLLVTTGLFVRALQSAAQTDTGYDMSNVRVFTIETTLAGYRGQRTVALADTLLERTRALSGVQSVATSRMIPLQGGGLGLGRLRVPGYTSARGDERFSADWDVVSPGFFQTLGMTLTKGRGFTDADREGRPFVAIVNETFAALAWSGRDAVGQVIYQTPGTGDVSDRPLTIVGVARNAHYRSVGEAPRPFIYVPLAQQPMTELNMYVKHAPGRQVAEEIPRLVASVDPALPVIANWSLEEAAGIGLVPQRLAAAVAGSVGVIGLLLTALGLYGLMAFQAVQRTREIAVRMALGATRGSVLSMMLAQGAKIAVAGTAAGVMLAGGVAIGVRGLLVGVQPLDAVSFAAAAVVLGVVLLAACFIPARRAAAANPAAALRAE